MLQPQKLVKGNGLVPPPFQHPKDHLTHMGAAVQELDYVVVPHWSVQGHPDLPPLAVSICLGCHQAGEPLLPCVSRI